MTTLLDYLSAFVTLKVVFPHIQMELLVFQFVSIAPYSPDPILLTLTLEVFVSIDEVHSVSFLQDKQGQLL